MDPLWLNRFSRLVIAAFGSGIAGGAVAGLTARLVMFAIRLANPAFNGAVTHEAVVNGQWTIAGSLSLVLEGAFVGASGGAVYLVVRPLLIDGPTPARGVLFGLLALALFGSLVIDGGYEYSRFVDPWQSVSAFAAVYLVYGVVVASVADLIAPVPPRPRSSIVRHPLRRTGSVGLVVVALVAAWSFVAKLRFHYGF